MLKQRLEEIHGMSFPRESEKAVQVIRELLVYLGLLNGAAEHTDCGTEWCGGYNRGCHTCDALKKIDALTKGD